MSKNKQKHKTDYERRWVLPRVQHLFFIMQKLHKIITMVRRQHPSERLWLNILQLQKQKSRNFTIT